MTTTATLDELIRARARSDLRREFENHIAAFPWLSEWGTPTQLHKLDKDGKPVKIMLREAIKIVFAETEASMVERREQDAVRAFLENHEAFARDIGSLQDSVDQIEQS